MAKSRSILDKKDDWEQQGSMAAVPYSVSQALLAIMIHGSLFQLRLTCIQRYGSLVISVFCLLGCWQAGVSTGQTSKHFLGFVS